MGVQSVRGLEYGVSNQRGGVCSSRGVAYGGFSLWCVQFVRGLVCEGSSVCGGPVFEGFRTKGVQSVAVCSLRVSVCGGCSLS